MANEDEEDKETVDAPAQFVATYADIRSGSQMNDTELITSQLLKHDAFAASSMREANSADPLERKRQEVYPAS